LKTCEEININWANQLFKDFINFLIKNNNFESKSLINNKSKYRRFLKRIDNGLHYYENLNFYSLYYDFTRKIFLYKKLSKESKVTNVIIPECGICGFDVFICKILGFKKIFCYDKDPNVKKSIKKIWDINNIKIYSMHSKDFFKIKFRKGKYLVIVPDWRSQELKNIMLENRFLNLKKNTRFLHYANPKNFKDHLNCITKLDIIKFHAAIENHVLYS